MLVSQKIILTIHKNISDNGQVSVLAKSNIAVVKKANVSLKLAIYQMTSVMMLMVVLA